MTDQITDIKLEHPHQEVDEHTGRFDTGEELEPEKDRETIGRFDSGEELEPEKDRETIGRFDSGEELEPEKDRETTGRFDSGPDADGICTSHVIRPTRLSPGSRSGRSAWCSQTTTR